MRDLLDGMIEGVREGLGRAAAGVARRLPERRHTRLLAQALACGVGGGVAAVAFELAMDGLGRLFLGTDEPALAGVAGWRLLAPIGVAVVGGAIAVVGTRRGKPLGVPDVVAAVRGEDVTLDLRDGASSTGAALLAIAGGQSAGREGPIVMLAGTLAAVLGKAFGRSPADERVIVAAGAAAGIAASFNSPLGGAFFAMEVLLGEFSVEAFAPIVVASVAGTVTGQSLLGDRLALRFPAFALEQPSELLVFPVLGLVCGLVTVALRSALRRSTRWLGTLPIPDWLHPAVGGALVAALATAGVPHVMGNGYALLDAMAGGTMRLGVGMLAVILAAKVVATAFAYSGRSGGGIFAPTLFLGAVTGQLVGEVAKLAAPAFAPEAGVLATVGMGAVAAAVAHAPVTMALMIAEMTGNYAIVLPLLVTIAVAVLVSTASDGSSLYVQVLLDRGLLRSHPPPSHAPVRVADLMSPVGGASVGVAARIGEVVPALRVAGAVFVVDDDGRPVGVVAHCDLTASAPDDRSPVGALARPVGTVRVDHALADVIEALEAWDRDDLPVVDADGRLVGVVTARAIARAAVTPTTSR